MRNYQDKTLVAIDFETANNARDSVCSVALVRVENGKIVAEAEQLICPPELYFIHTDVHGITEEDVENAPSFASVWGTMQHLVKGADYFVAHNAPFDRSVLQACCNNEGIKTPEIDFLCTVKIARDTWDIRPTKLSDVCNHLKIPLNHHNALSDARACANIVIAAMGRG